MKYLLLLFLIVFIYSIFKNLYDLLQIRKLIEILYNYLHSVTFQKDDYQIDMIKKDNYTQCLNKVLSKYPSIAKYKTCYDILEYGAVDKENYRSAHNIYNNLQMNKNYITHNLLHSLNPVNGLKQLFKLPSSIIAWIGFVPSDVFSKFFNIFCWLITYLLGMYSQEIKLFISTLIHK